MSTEATILERVLGPDVGPLPAAVARYLLTREFPPQDRRRMEELCAKEHAHTLSAAEQGELESYRHVDRLLNRVQEKTRQTLASQSRAEPAQEPPVPAGAGPARIPGVPAGIRRAQEAFWRALPSLLKRRGNHGKWVAYHGEERIGIAATEAELLRKCRRRGLPEDAFYTDVIIPYDRPPWVPERLDPRPAAVEAGPRTLAEDRP